jgi:hypothetical protein
MPIHYSEDTTLAAAFNLSTLLGFPKLPQLNEQVVRDAQGQATATVYIPLLSSSTTLSHSLDLKFFARRSKVLSCK